ncbi:MAG: hypothetical protein PHD81_03840 [Candidatus Nanoarchaeia archaeon]|nr:hypothetical protein [Candidatus Nanoarchaeia archaeon]MDD5588214.1 hypothetical protein [Candidatus Nanoarchaeia archaeon]
MKVKNLYRALGVANTAVSEVLTYVSVQPLLNLNLQKIIDVFSGDQPYSYKLMAGGSLVTNILLTSACSFYALNGIIDTIKGTHCYLVLRTGQKLSILKEDKVNKEIKRQLEIGEMELSDLVKKE